MKRSYLKKVYFKKRPSGSLRKCQKNSGENVSKDLIQVGSMTNKVFGKMCILFSLQNERVAIVNSC